MWFTSRREATSMGTVVFYYLQGWAYNQFQPAHTATRLFFSLQTCAHSSKVRTCAHSQQGPRHYAHSCRPSTKPQNLFLCFYITIHASYPIPYIYLQSAFQVTSIYKNPLHILWANTVGQNYSLHIYKNGFPLQNLRSTGQSSVALTSAHLLRFAEDRFVAQSSHLQKRGSKTWVLGPNRPLTLTCGSS